MTRNLLRISVVAMATFALFVMTTSALAQSGEELVKQLSGKAEAPARDAAQLAQAYQKAIDYLMPLMSAENVGSRYAPQILLQDMGSHAARPGAETEREILAKVLMKTVDQPNLENTVRHWIVLQIERIGKGESVPGLAKLMTAQDEHLRDYARRALEKNPDPSATDALLKALAEAKDAKWKIGLINALGSRQAQAAIDPLAQILEDSDRKVASAAVTALSNIGGQDSAMALVRVFDTPLSPLHMKAAQGMIDIAQELVKNSDYAGATQVYEAMYEGATEVSQRPDGINPFNIRAAAIVGLMSCNPGKGAEHVAALMQDKDPKVRAAVVQAARATPGKAPLQALTALLPDLDPQSQVQVLGLIADRGDLSSIDPVIKVLNREESVRLAAIETLTKLGTDKGAEALLEVAAASPDRAQKAALEGLAVMAGPRVDEVIAENTGEYIIETPGTPTAMLLKRRTIAIGLLGKRRAAGAAELLLGYAADADEQISRAAFAALVDVANTVDVAKLVDLLAQTKSAAVRSAGAAALRAALASAKDKDATAAAVLGRMESADAQTKISLVTCLDALGGTAALDAVCKAAHSSDEALSDAGIRTLVNWPDFEAVERLILVVTNDQGLTYYALAVRGALRLIGAGESVPLEERIALCLAVLENARRDDERRQAIAVLGMLPGQQAIDRLTDLLKSDTLKTEAAMASVDLAGRMIPTNRDAARALAQKIRDMNISEEVNRQADTVISGRLRFRGRR